MNSAFIDFMRIRFLTMLAYRVNYYSGILIYTLNIGVYYFTWQAIYGSSGETRRFHGSTDDNVYCGLVDGACFLF